MLLIKSSLTLLSVLLIACSSTNKAASEEKNTPNTKEIEMKNSEMLAAGFSMAVVVESKEEGDCPFTLKMKNKDNEYYLDPINMTDAFKKNGEKVWVKYSGLRRMNRCSKANPISINEIEKRVE